MGLKKILLVCAYFFCFLFIFIAFFHPASLNLDLGRHLLFGKYMVQTHEIIKTNLISYTNTNYHYVNSHWLSEIILYLIVNFTGFNGLVIFIEIISLLTFLSLIIYSIKRFHPISILLTSLIILNLVFLRNEIRPEIFSYFLLTLFLLILYKFKEKKTLLIYLLIPMEALWVNLHIFFVLGLVLIFIFAIDEFFSGKTIRSQKFKTLSKVFLLSIIATFLNPNFINGALFPLSFNLGYSVSIAENQNIIYMIRNGMYYQPFLTAICYGIFMFLLGLRYRKKLFLSDFLLIFTFTFGVVYANRNIAFFAYAIFIPSVKILSLVINNLLIFAKKTLSNKRIVNFENLILFFICMCLVLFLFKHVSQQMLGLGANNPGKNSITFYLDNKLHGPIYNNFDSGQYLAYSLFPKEKVFIDARPEAYPKEFGLNVYYPATQNPNLLKPIFIKYKVNIIFVFYTYESSKNIQFYLNSSDFKPIYLDDFSLILIKNNNENKKLISKYLIDKNTFKIGTNLDTNSLINYLYFFDRANWVNLEKQVYFILHKNDPNDCTIKNYGYIYQNFYNQLKNIKVSGGNCN